MHTSHTVAFSRKEVLQAWWQASRPPFYIATLIPVLLGFVAAGKDFGKWDVTGLLGIMFICLLQHLAANLANDLFDHLLGVDTGETIGGSRVIQQGKITPRALAVALVLLYGGTVVCTAIGVSYFGLPRLWWVALFAMFSSYFYVAPPLRYGHRALGEVMVFANMGLAMAGGTYYAITGVFDARIIELAVPVGLMVAGILYYQSLPEIETDKAAGKHTLANVLGPRLAVGVLLVWWPVVWGLLLRLWATGAVGWPVILGVLGSVPLHVTLMRRVRSNGGHWLRLDAHGHLVRKMYLLCGVSLVLGVLVS